jgi:hypothetical protein
MKIASGSAKKYLEAFILEAFIYVIQTMDAGKPAGRTPLLKWH